MLKLLLVIVIVVAPMALLFFYSWDKCPPQAEADQDAGTGGGAS